MKVQERWNEFLNSTPIGWPIRVDALAGGLRMAGCTLSHQKDQ